MALKKPHKIQNPIQSLDGPLTAETLKTLPGFADISDEEAEKILESLRQLALILLKCSGRTKDIDEQ